MTGRTGAGVSYKSGSLGKLDGGAVNDGGQRDPEEDVSYTGTARMYLTYESSKWPAHGCDKVFGIQTLLSR